MAEQRNVGIIIAVLIAAGGLVLVQGGGGPGKGAPNLSSTVAVPAPGAPTPGAPLCALDAPCVAADYFSGDRPSDGLWNRHCSDMQFLIALVPDPIDAHIGWLFDPVVESIQRAAEANHYSLDRFALPWEEGAAKKAACRPPDSPSDARTPAPCGELPTHQFLPGVLLFRQTTADTAAADAPLAVLLVGETPTGGVHKHALHAALDRIAECRADSIAILGPTFSGSTRSLRMALREWWDAHPGWAERNQQWRLPLPQHATECSATSLSCELPAAIRVVSGTATSVPVDELRAVGAAPDGTDIVSFAATVIPDAYALTTVLDRYLVAEHGVRPNKIALLVEANSAYGQSVRQVGGAEADASTARPDDQESVLTLLFPMHIGEARAAIEKARSARPTDSGGVPAARPDLGVSLDDGRVPHDLPPQMSPGLTGPAAEFALANLLATISRKEITYVGLIASDTRDKLFLARQVRKYCPDVRLFTLESDLLYAHPDNRDALAGMLVASTYPLFNRTQEWTTSPQATRLQFSSSAAAGVYNAALVLLGHNAEWLMADYAEPGAWRRQTADDTPRTLLYQRPMLWLTAVGNGGVWPVRIYSPDTGVEAYAWKQLELVTETTRLRSEGMERGSARSAVLIWLALGAICLVQVARYFAAPATHDDPMESHSNSTLETAWQRVLGIVGAEFYAYRTQGRLEQLGYIGIGVGALASAYAYWSRPFLIRPDAAQVPYARFIISVCLGSLAFMLAHAVLRLLPAQPPRAVRRLLLAGGWMLVLAFGAWVESGGGRLPTWTTAEMITFERVTNLESQLSPLVPCLLVAAAWFLLARGHLVRLLLVEQRVANMLSGHDTRGAVLEAAGRAALRVVSQPWRRFSTLIAGALWLLPAVLVGQAFLPTYESRTFDALFRTAFFLAGFAVVAAFTQALTLWWYLRRLLDRLAAHPLADAFARQPERLHERVRESLYAFVPSLVDLEFAHESLRRLIGGLDAAVRQQLAAALTEPAVLDGLVQRLNAHHERAAAELVEAAKTDWAHEAEVHCRHARAELDAAAGALVDDLLTPVWDHPAAFPREAQAWLASGEDFVATQSVGYIGYFFWHARNLMFFATGGLVLLLLTVPSYPFQPQRLLNLLIWVLVLLAVVGVVTTLMQMNRSIVLTNLSGSKQQGLAFDRTLLSPLLKYGALPLFSLIATQFPGIGETVFSWVEPLLRAMK